MLRSLALSFLLYGLFGAPAKAPERTVRGATLVSQHDPHIQIDLPVSAQYVGADRWDLYGIADCELHAFVQADRKRNVHELYWIQFEGYLSSKPDMHHTYDSPGHAEIGGLDFYVDTWVSTEGKRADPGSDLEHIESLIRAKGYKMPAGMIYVRLVHLLDAEKRRELMIIYGEDLEPKGFTVAGLAKNGPAHDRLPALEAALVEAAKQKIELQP
ncbi:hypothetical protein [Granulicella sp. S190]|uniref:hypothetical protein n=1 Tax=Granulicella sp. S190 TaxID=1747226 RepID=UPI00131E5A73|nr:hypothetical protein [Granulicella sp. S190]